MSFLLTVAIRTSIRQLTYKIVKATLFPLHPNGWLNLFCQTINNKYNQTYRKWKRNDEQNWKLLSLFYLIFYNIISRVRIAYNCFFSFSRFNSIYDWLGYRDIKKKKRLPSCIHIENWLLFLFIFLVSQIFSFWFFNPVNGLSAIQFLIHAFEWVIH